MSLEGTSGRQLFVGLHVPQCSDATTASPQEILLLEGQLALDPGFRSN